MVLSEPRNREFGLTRRRFIGGTALAAAVAAMPVNVRRPRAPNRKSGKDRHRAEGGSHIQPIPTNIVRPRTRRGGGRDETQVCFDAARAMRARTAA
jgi:hypothetical protein